MKRNSILFAAFAIAVALFMTGCSSSKEEVKKDQTDQNASGEFKKTDSDSDVIPSTDKPADKTSTTPSKKEDDIPAAEKYIPQKDTPPVTKDEMKGMDKSGSTKSGMMMWSVQIGAFKMESGAIQLVNEAKTKFNQPVYKDFDPVSGFYKVSIGSYQVREQAAQFKTEVQSKGYPDAFTVEVRR